ncbi:hypothetical protein [Archangium lansingense]|uniref:Glycoside hydrolase family 38 N-terminal domain-containing protein n=1 Tax=Archangium lansingense TaxID=2995310 RepID=A0ABT4AEJ8_9BACT|nr:hypothetical protein [Archangium lansinium]MCY1080050.1 hypothetical protein [Archangium lansinium]
MRLLILPPHRDLTLAPDVPEGWQVVDVARDFFRRVLSPEAIAREAGAREGGPATAQKMRELLLLRAAQSLQERSGGEGLARLRARGAVLTALSSSQSGVRLELDGLELEDGTTERSADVLRVVGRPAPYTDELAFASERIAQAAQVRLWLEGASQLPAAVWLARACPATVALELAGPFATAHRKVLGRMTVFHRATFPEDVVPLRWRVVPLEAEPGPESLVWIPAWMGLEVHSPPKPPEEYAGFDWMSMEREGPYPRGAPGRASGQILGDAFAADVRAFTGGAPWAGHVRFSSLYQQEALVESGCRVAIVGFCSIGYERLVDLDGYGHRLSELRTCLRSLSKAGVRVVAEWWVGAPRMDEEVLELTLRRLEAEPLFDWVAGVHPFQAGAGRTPKDYRGWSLEWGDPPADFDLARTRRFEAPGTVSRTRLPEVLETLSSQLQRQVPLSPGRVAGAYLHHPPPREPMPAPPPQVEASEDAPPPEPPRPSRVRMDPDCAVVRLPASLEGAPEAAWYVANLRTGRRLAVEAWLAPVLDALRDFTPAEEAFAGVEELRRASLVDSLVSESVLVPRF